MPLPWEVTLRWLCKEWNCAPWEIDREYHADLIGQWIEMSNLEAQYGT